MSVFDKLTFWKHKEEEDFDLSKDLGMGDMPGIGEMPGEFPGAQGEDTGQALDLGKDFKFPGRGQQPVEQVVESPLRAPSGATVTEYPPNAPRGQPFYPSAEPASRDMELVSAKMDALKASIETINQRLANIERMISDERERTRKTW